MIRIHFSVKEKRGGGGTLGKVSSIGFHIIEQKKVKTGVIRWTSLKNDKFDRLYSGQPVITVDGFGIISCRQNYKVTKNKDGSITLPTGVNVNLRTTRRDKIFYNLGNINVIDIIDSITGARYPAMETDYQFLLLDDYEVEYYVTKSGKAMLSLSARKSLQDVSTFSKRINSIQLLNLLIKKGIWTKK